jgi:hypothetical protein
MTLSSGSQTTPSLGKHRREKKLRKPARTRKHHQPILLISLATMAGQENEDREEASRTTMAALDMGTDNLAKLLLPPQKQSGRPCC